MPFTPIPPSRADTVSVAKGFGSEVVLRSGDDLGNGAWFGSDPDFTAFFPIDLPTRGFDLSRSPFGYAPADASSSEGLLVVNHEQFDPRFVHGASWRQRTDEQKLRERTEVGLSISRVAHRDGRWQLVADRGLNRRYDATTEFLLTGPAAAIDGGPRVIGTLANCSGGVTPWGTVLSCEENFQDYTSDDGYAWNRRIYGRRHYGWVVEIDPFDPGASPRKHTAMGRFRHENVAIRVARNGTVVAYMGDDRKGSCVFKFIADRKLSGDRTADMRILEKGRLFAADFANGRWLPLGGTAEVLVDAARAALEAGATPVDRPEDLEVHPVDGSVFIAMTNNSDHGNFHGHIVRLVDEPAELTFEWSIFATGGPQSGFSSPDNLLFDAQGNLWMASDVSGKAVGRGIYSFQGNNSLYYFPAGTSEVYRFASGPVECELTGPAWTPDGSTMFLSVQHPGGHSADFDTSGPASHWPDGGNSMPRGAVVAITGFQ